MKLTLGKKLFFYTSGTLVVLLLMTFLVLERNQSRQWEEHLRAQSLSFARFATPELLKLFRGSFPPREGATLRDVYDFLGFNRDLIRFSFLSTSGRVLFRSPNFPDFIDLDLTLVDEGDGLSSRLQDSRTTVRTWTVPGDGRVLDLVTPAFGPTGEQILSVRYLLSYDSVDARLGEVRLYFLRIALISVFFSLILVALVARRVTRPIKELTEGARAIARADLQTRIETHSSDEIGSLARAFNEMTESLAASRAELTEKNHALTEANEELRQVQAQLIRAERLAAIGQLAAGVSHEIDNPVGIILGYAELLLEDLEGGDPRREDVRAIIEECKRCKRITGGLLGFARSAPAQHEPLSLDTLVDETIASVRPQKLFKEIVFRFRTAQPHPSIVGDADQLRQVLVNLLLNSAQAMGGKGELTVEVRQEGSLGVILVSDTGPGVPPGLRERIFEPFFSTKARGEGTGLGLSVCRKLAEEHDGSLSAGTAEGGGAQFRLALPLAETEKCFDKGSGDSLG
jgi:signal transduction histidine kinase